LITTNAFCKEFLDVRIAHVCRVVVIFVMFYLLL
jgi:hypothetical protein